MKWIKASDELPPAGKPVVIRDEDGYTYSDMAIAWDKDITNYQWLDETEDAGEDWISVETKRPDSVSQVLCINSGGMQFILWYNFDLKKWIERSKPYDDSHSWPITHWRNLPPPPKQ